MENQSQNMDPKNLSQKRSIQHMDESNKRMKQDNLVDQSNTMKITNLNSDCLEYIFGKLKLRDLLNVMDSSKLFIEPVKWIYSFRYSQKRIQLFVEDFIENKDHIRITNSSINITSLSIFLKMLRCFGHKIAKIDVSYQELNQMQSTELDRYLHKYCHTSLIDVHIIGGSNDLTMSNLIEPFANVELLRFSNSQCLSSELTDFNKWFPKMRCLTILMGVYMQNPRCIEVRFPHLKALNVRYVDLCSRLVIVYQKSDQFC